MSSTLSTIFVVQVVEIIVVVVVVVVSGSNSERTAIFILASLD